MTKPNLIVGRMRGYYSYQYFLSIEAEGKNAPAHMATFGSDQDDLDDLITFIGFIRKTAIDRIYVATGMWYPGKPMVDALEDAGVAFYLDNDAEDKGA